MTRRHVDRIRLANAEILGKGNLDLVDEVFAADYVAHSSGGAGTRGSAFVLRFIGQLRTAIPNLRVVEIEILLEKGDRVTWQRTLRGKHAAAFAGIPPSGKTVEWRDMHVSRFAGGRIVEEWVVSELAAQLMLKLPRG